MNIEAETAAKLAALKRLVGLLPKLESVGMALNLVNGAPSDFAAKLRSGKPLSTGESELLAQFLEGKLTPPRGRRPTGFVLNLDGEEFDIVFGVAEDRMKYADVLADQFTAEMRAAGELYGKADEAVEKAASKAGVSAASLLERRRRARRVFEVWQAYYDGVVNTVLGNGKSSREELQQ